MKKIYVWFFAVLCGIALVATAAPSAVAQEDDGEFTLEEITVTAQKRAENQQKVPIAMEVISAEDLRMSGKNDLNEILSDVGSAIIQKAPDGIRVSLRGVSDDSYPFHGASVSMPTVAVNMDGVYSNRKDMSTGLFDLERVEVLYGPQATLYSSNSPGGIVNIESARPKLDQYEASGTLEVGNYELLHTEGMVNAPVSDTLALRAAFTTSVHDGYISNGGDSEDAKNARLRLLYQPSENLTFLITGELSKVASAFGNGVDAFVDESDVDDPWESDFLIAPPVLATSKRLYARMDWDTGLGTLSVLPSYSTRKGEGIRIQDMGFQVDTLDIFQDSEEKSIEVRLASPAESPLKWIVGFNYYEQDDISNDDNQNGINFTHLNQTEEAWAAYANVTYPFTDALRVTAGIRYSNDDLVMINEETRGPVVAPEYAYEIHEDTYSDPDYKIGFEYDLGENSMLYADYSTSYRVQSMAGGGVGVDREPEMLKAYTAGVKNRFLDNKLQLNLSAYYYDYQNYKYGDMKMAWGINGVDPIGYGGTYQPLSSEVTGDPNSSGFGDGRMMGLDVRSTFVMTSKDIFNLTVNYLKSEWTDLVLDYYYDYGALMSWPPPPPDVIIPIGVEPAETISYNGDPMTAAPEFTINASYSHRFSFTNGASLEAKIDGQYKTEYELTWRHYKDYPMNYQEAFTLYNATLTYNSPDNNWSLSVYGRNLGNYAEKRAYFGEPVYQMSVGNPRTYGAVLSARF
jgi:iron complex outermembrane receptor protein